MVSDMNVHVGPLRAKFFCRIKICIWISYMLWFTNTCCYAHSMQAGTFNQSNTMAAHERSYLFYHCSATAQRTGAIRKLFLRALLANSFRRAMTPLTRNGYHNKPVPISPCLIVSVKNSNKLSCVRNKKTRRETFQCFDLVPLILEIWRYIS